jgi:hypothetical protein
MVTRAIRLLALVCLVSYAQTARGDLVENGLYDVAGVWSGGVLRATTIEPAEEDVEPGILEVEGRITALDLGKRVLQIGPLTVQWSETTRFIAIKPEALKVAAWIELEGKMVGPRRLLATVIERAAAAGEANYLRIVGAVNGVKENRDGSVRFEMIAVPVFAPADVHRGLKSSGRDPEEEEDEETSGTSLKISGEYEVKLDYRKKFALERPAKDDLLRLDQEFQLRLFYPHNDWISLFLEGKVFGEHELYTERGARRSEVALERGETWVRLDRLFGSNLAFKIGRQNFEEPRRWWWDDELDAVGARYRQHPWSFELGVAREVLPENLLDDFIDPEEEGVLRVLARADWRYSKNHRLGLFFLHQYDGSRTQSPGALLKTEREDESDAKLWWAGIRAMGSEPWAAYGDFSYWADAAIVAGSETLLDLEDESHRRKRVVSGKHHRVRGWALDVGGRWASQLPARPIFILGYAFGSGDKDPDRGVDRAFRQTGLQSNDEEFRTYGELLRPELSNLSIPTVAVQFPFFSESHIEFAYRHFRQHHAAPFLRDARIEADPNGVSKTIGQEWMIYTAVKEWDRVEIEWVGAAFRAGRAYGPLSGKMAYSLFTKVTFSF